MRTRQITTACLLAGTILGFSYYVWWRPQPFDSAKWKGAVAKGKPSIRYDMRQGACKLLAEHVVNSQADVLRYFGPCDSGKPEDSHWLYNLGPQWMPVDSWWLDICFDEQGNVKSFSVRSD